MYVAFLRGINVGGKTVKMDILKKSFEEIGFANVRTLLASGNVLFESETSDEPVLVRQIESKLREVFGFEIIVQIRTKEYLHELILANPFKEGGSVDVKLYVSFLTPNTKNVLTIPYESPDKTFSIISATKYELFSTLYTGGKSTDAMNIIDKRFGKKVTTRNWNTIKKIAMLQ